MASQPDDGSQVTQKDVDAVRKLNGLFTNRIFIQPGLGHLRMNFGEMVGDEAVYHTAIVVPVSEAPGFADLIDRMVKAVADLEAIIREAQNGE
ncbi:hypothetical protein KRZ98_05740 [Sphingobium sp. AS12]|uniref:hypothetical protein n=1 Tax=Sphingobium sp. AS12 TaxID=2849495 RepID=UPI001C312178|nr:hypothetical protein [Sphingobium sp. AS12]MBV2147790.1 hypothetical protein [Sphingobium sp. AS12]